MNDTDPTPFELETLLDDVDRVANLPQSQAFEQVMYDNLSTRVTRFFSEGSIVFHPRLMRTQFPQNLKDCFVSSSNLQVDKLRVVQLVTEASGTPAHEEPPRQAKMAFEVDGTEYSFTTDGTDATITIETQNGPSSKHLGDGDFTAFLASILYAMQYEPDSTHEFRLVDDPLIVRRESSDIDEGLVERIIMTMGDLGGNAETITTSLFDTGGDVLEVELVAKENPRVSGVNNSMSLSRITGTTSNGSLIHQNEASIRQGDMFTADRLVNHYAEEVSFDLINEVEDARVIDPAEDFEKYASICTSFITHIGPMMQPYEESETTY